MKKSELLKLAKFLDVSTQVDKKIVLQRYVDGDHIRDEYLERLSQSKKSVFVCIANDQIEFHSKEPCERAIYQILSDVIVVLNDKLNELYRHDPIEADLEIEIDC